MGLFALGMLISSLQLACLNSTTIENLNRRSKVWALAVHIPRPLDLPGMNAVSAWARTFSVVSYPTSQEAFSYQDPDLQTQNSRRDFAILFTRPGENPFDLGSRLANLREVLGNEILDWFLPLKHSPCSDHSNQESAFRLGPVVQRLRRDAGLETCRYGTSEHNYSAESARPLGSRADTQASQKSSRRQHRRRHSQSRRHRSNSSREKSSGSRHSRNADRRS